MKRLEDYTVVVAPNDSATWWAYVPAIDGCQALGESPEEAQTELAHVFSMIAEIYDQDGRILPEDIKELVPFAS
ncbi:MAG: type II toxin-antitoxin system HicB family antitoxin [Dehalococcoidia bacterium]